MNTPHHNMLAWKTDGWLHWKDNFPFVIIVIATEEDEETLAVMRILPPLQKPPYPGTQH
ncbi:MAG: hypothetical protein Q7S16_04950 [bacterium]|nr:hypothetical protein [bacterium]